jgi:glycosyltransferase involved in cell wall biosynthesis
VFLSPYYKSPLFAPCPVVLTIHDLFFITYLGRRRLFYDGLMVRLARLYAARAIAIITDSEYSEQAIVTRLGIMAEKITVIPVPLGNEFHETPLTDEAKLRYGITDPYLLYVGNFWPHKNLPRLLQAFAGLGESIRGSYQLVLAGYDHQHQPALLELARTLGMSDRILFPGLIADRDLPAIYSGCSLFVLPSLEEGFGLPALEAMACGAPVIAANRAAIPEVVGKAAILFDPEDVAAMTKVMTDVLTQPELGTALRRQGLMRSKEFSLNRTTGRVLTLLQEVSEGRYQTRRTP